MATLVGEKNVFTYQKRQTYQNRWMGKRDLRLTEELDLKLFGIILSAPDVFLCVSMESSYVFQ